MDSRPPTFRLATPWRLSAAVALFAVVYGVAGLRYHGLTSDSPSLFYAGDRTLFWLTHRDTPGALDFLGPEPAQFHTAFERDPEFADPLHYPVFPGLFAALTSRLFHDRLGWLGVVDAHHLGLVLIHATALLVECWFLCRLAGRRAAVAATIALALFPSALGHSFNNAKDWPCAQFYACAVLAAAVGLLEERGRWLVVAGALTGLALSCKLNGIFVFITVGLWAPVLYLLVYHRRRPVPPGVVAAGLAAPYVAAMTFVALWPWLYYGSITDWWGHLNGYVTFMVNYGSSRRPTWTAYPLRPLAFMTPPLVLVCAAAYAVTGWRGDRRRAALWALYLIWLGVPLLRIAAPRSNFYDANRHFIEYVPALCAMAGSGFDDLYVRTSALISRFVRSVRAAHLIETAIVTLSVLVLAWPVAEYAPYETTYFNSLIGGLGRAQQTRLFSLKGVDVRIEGTEGDYWYNSLRAGLRDIRRRMKGHDLVGLCGPDATLARMNWENAEMPRFADSRDPRVDFIYVMPRGTFCDASVVDQLKAGHVVLEQEQRGGGLIYLVLGKP